MKSLRVLFFGNESLATGLQSHPVIFNALLDGGYDVAGLVVHSRGAVSRSAKKEAIIESAETRGIPILNPDSLKDSADEIASYGADIGVLVAYGKIVPENVIKLFNFGIINVHPSLLPLYRGSTPIETALLDGAVTTGVSVMSLVPEMDAGPVYVQQSVQIAPHETKSELAGRLHEIGTTLILETLHKISEDQAKTIDQDNSLATFTKQIQKSDGLLDFTKPAMVLEREIRAYAGWPGSWFEYNSTKYTVTDANYTNTVFKPNIGGISVQQNNLYITTKDGSLVINKIKPEGKKEMPITAFLNGYKSLFD